MMKLFDEIPYIEGEGMTGQGNCNKNDSGYGGLLVFPDRY